MPYRLFYNVCGSSNFGDTAILADMNARFNDSVMYSTEKRLLRNHLVVQESFEPNILIVL